MTDRTYPPAPTQRYIIRRALANGGRYVTRLPEHRRMCRRMVARGWFDELPNPTADGGVAFDITESGMRALKEVHHD